jgi:hypothetical protein
MPGGAMQSQDYVRWFANIELGIDSISVNPASVLKTLKTVHAAELAAAHDAPKRTAVLELVHSTAGDQDLGSKPDRPADLLPHATA